MYLNISQQEQFWLWKSQHPFHSTVHICQTHIFAFLPNPCVLNFKCETAQIAQHHLLRASCLNFKHHFRATPSKLKMPHLISAVPTLWILKYHNLASSVMRWLILTYIS